MTNLDNVDTNCPCKNHDLVRVTAVAPCAIDNDVAVAPVLKWNFGARDDRIAPEAETERDGRTDVFRPRLSVTMNLRPSRFTLAVLLTERCCEKAPTTTTDIGRCTGSDTDTTTIVIIIMSTDRFLLAAAAAAVAATAASFFVLIFLCFFDVIVIVVAYRHGYFPPHFVYCVVYVEETKSCFADLMLD